MNMINPFQSQPSTIFEPSKLEHHIARSDSRARAIMEIVQNLVDAGNAPIQEMRAAIQRSQYHQAAHMLHTLRGSVANLGGQRVCELTMELEQLLDAGETTNLVTQLLDWLDQEFSLFLGDASEWLERQKEKYALQTQHPRRLQERMQLLSDCLAENDLRAFDLFEELERHLQKQMAAPDFLAFSAALQSLEFGKALTYMQGWR